MIYFFLGIFIFSSFFLGGFLVGPYSIRIYISVIAFLIIILSQKKIPLFKDIGIYSLFIFFYMIALLINGEFIEESFPKVFLGKYFICFISFYLFYFLVNTKERIHYIIFLLTIFGVLNGLISVFQFFGNQYAQIIPLVLNPDEITTERIENYSKFESGLGIGVMGLFGSIVKNGYLSAIFAIASLNLFHINKDKSSKIFYFLLTIFLLFVIFITQQRLILIVCLSIYIYYFLKNPKSFVFLFYS
jgi:hypothetical protein